MIHRARHVCWVCLVHEACRLRKSRRPRHPGALRRKLLLRRLKWPLLRLKLAKPLRSLLLRFGESCGVAGRPLPRPLRQLEMLLRVYCWC